MRIILLSHGAFSKGLTDACSMILGETTPSLCSLSLDAAAGAVDFENRLAGLVADMREPYLILCDLFFGTPFQTALRLAENDIKENRCRIVCGANLPMLLEVLTAQMGADALTPAALADVALRAGKSGVCIYDEKAASAAYAEDEAL